MSAESGRPPHERFLFMLALPRSGSTLLAYVLDSHSRIHVEHEDSGQPHQAVADKEVHNLQIKIQSGFTAYLESLLAPSGKEFLVCSRYYDPRHVQLIAGALGPQAKFIVLTRERMWRSFKDADGVPHIVPARQISQFSAARRLVARRYAHVETRYEDMVQSPQAAFAQVCRFIGVDYEPDMLDYARFDHTHLRRRGNEKTRRFGRIVAGPAGGGPAQRGLIGDLLERLGLRRTAPPRKDS